jgi:glycosyltransferase involved in cell wall biosynthesis
MMKIALVTNTPPPYRVPIFTRLANASGIDFHVIFCARREPNRLWDLPPLRFPHYFLHERFFTVNGRYIHFNPDVMPLLARLGPDVIITDGFNPTHLMAFLIAQLKGILHIAMTDGTDLSEQKLSFKHRLVRRLVYARSAAFISASGGGDRLYQSYDIKPERCFHSWLCVENAEFSPSPYGDKKRFDFIFCGRMEKAKDPFFALIVARQTAIDMQQRLRILLVGSGSLEPALRAAALQFTDWIDVQFHGFATQRALPRLYRSARLFLFTTHDDVWGIVANEACAAGLPVLVSPYAGVAGELIRDNRNGFVRELEVGLWVDCARQLLSNEALYREFSTRSLQLVAPYNFESAAMGIVDACRLALGERSHMTSNTLTPSTADPRAQGQP